MVLVYLVFVKRTWGNCLSLRLKLKSNYSTFEHFETDFHIVLFGRIFVTSTHAQCHTLRQLFWYGVLWWNFNIAKHSRLLLISRFICPRVLCAGCSFRKFCELVVSNWTIKRDTFCLRTPFQGIFPYGS